MKLNALTVIVASLLVNLPTFTQTDSTVTNFFKNLVGTWQIENSQSYEIWSNDAGIFSAKGITIVNEDTLVNETVTISFEKNKIYYVAEVKNQNAGKPIKFILTHCAKNKLVFVNNEHDFPKKIIYRLSSPEKLISEISNEEKKFVIKLRKLK